MNEQSNRSLLGKEDVRDYHRRPLAPRLSCLASSAKTERDLPPDSEEKFVDRRVEHGKLAPGRVSLTQL